MKIMRYGITSSPILVVDGQVKSGSKLLSVDEIIASLLG